MTHLENLQATLAHKRPAWVPYRAGFTPDLHRRMVEHTGTEDLVTHYGMTDLGGLTIAQPEGVPKLDFSPYWERGELPEGTEIDANGVAMVPSGYYHFWGYLSPLRNACKLSEIEDYPIEDIRDWDLSYLRKQVAERHAMGKVAGAHVGHIYETAWQIRGYEQFLIDMVERPSWAECLLERLAERNVQRAVALVEAGADVIRTGDDVANQNALMFAPGLWRRMIHARWVRIWQRIKEINPECRIWYHSDGNIAGIVGELADAGLDILNPLQPEAVDVDAVHERFGDRLTLDGCVGTQSTMPFGTPDEVRHRVREVVERYGQDGGLIVSPTHVLEPDVSVENVEAFFEACREYGTFGSA
jgi:uroporphyrinogen decarboxylase